MLGQLTKTQICSKDRETPQSEHNPGRHRGVDDQINVPHQQNKTHKRIQEGTVFTSNANHRSHASRPPTSRSTSPPKRRAELFSTTQRCSRCRGVRGCRSPPANARRQAVVAGPGSLNYGQCWKEKRASSRYSSPLAKENVAELRSSCDGLCDYAVCIIGNTVSTLFGRHRVRRSTVLDRLIDRLI